MKLHTFWISAMVATLVGVGQTCFLLVTWNYIAAYSPLTPALLAIRPRGVLLRGTAKPRAPDNSFSANVTRRADNPEPGAAS